MNWIPWLIFAGYLSGAAASLPAIYRHATDGDVWDETDQIMLMAVSLIACLFWPFLVLAWLLHKWVTGDRSRR